MFDRYIRQTVRPCHILTELSLSPAKWWGIWGHIRAEQGRNEQSHVRLKRLSNCSVNNFKRRRVATKVADHRTLVTLLSRHYANILHQALWLCWFPLFLFCSPLRYKEWGHWRNLDGLNDKEMLCTFTSQSPIISFLRPLLNFITLDSVSMATKHWLKNGQRTFWSPLVLDK